MIAPSDDSKLSTNTPTFVWSASTDDRQMDHYQFYLDGNLHFDSIPLIAIDNSSYTLTYDSLTGYYHLTFKNSISDGSHTWKIRAIDVLDNYAESVIWDFTIDTTSPNFVITNIGAEETNISAKDNSTWPTAVIDLDDNEPLLKGTGEANSSVDLTITIPDDPTQTHEFSIDSSGNWQKQLGIFPRGVTLTLDFVITDSVGHITSLEDIQIRIKTLSIVIPAASATPVVPTESPSPSPEIAGPVTSVTPSPSPTQIPSRSVLILPYLTPKEIIHEIIQEIEERVPQPIARTVAATPMVIKKGMQVSFTWLAPFMNLIIFLGLPLLTVFTIASSFNKPFSFSLWKKIALSLGFLPAGPTQGAVYDDQTNQGTPFALVSFFSQDEHHLYQDSVLTDFRGYYRGIKLPPNTYRLSIRKDGTLFPSNQPRPSYVLPEDHYLGEKFEISQTNNLPVLLIPLTTNSYENKNSFLPQIMSHLAYLQTYPTWFLTLMISVTTAVSLFSPTIWNWLVVSAYGLLSTYRTYQKLFVPKISGIVITPQQQSLGSALLKITILQNQKTQLTFSQPNGQFKFNLPPEKFYLTGRHVGYSWKEAPQNSRLVIDPGTITLSAEVIVVMEPNKSENK